MLTPVSVDNVEAVYATLPEGLGLQVGMVVQEPNTGNFYQLVQHNAAALAALGIGYGVKWLAPEDYTVEFIEDIADFTVGGNANAVTIPAGSYFWMLKEGRGELFVLAGATAGLIIAATATDGKLGVALVADQAGVRQANIIALEASPGGGGGLTLCEIH